jgi:hypothetical protein
MTISSAATGTPIPKPNQQFEFVDPKTGYLSNHGNQLLSAWYNFIVGMNRITPCNATGTNTITLTPLTASPLIEKYVDYEIYAFTAENDASNLVSATVTPKSGTLATLKVYKSDSTTRAGTTDIIAGSFYLLIYVDSLDSGNGAFVLK